MGIRTVNGNDVVKLLGRKMIHIGNEDNRIGAIYFAPYFHELETFRFHKAVSDIMNSEKNEWVILVSGLCIFNRTKIVLEIVNLLVRNKDVDILFYFDGDVHNFEEEK